MGNATRGQKLENAAVAAEPVVETARSTHALELMHPPPISETGLLILCARLNFDPQLSLQILMDAGVARRAQRGAAVG